MIDWYLGTFKLSHSEQFYAVMDISVRLVITIVALAIPPLLCLSLYTLAVILYQEITWMINPKIQPTGEKEKSTERVSRSQFKERIRTIRSRTRKGDDELEPITKPET